VNSNRIYLDNAATTALRPEVANAMREAAGDGAYNPSSLHAEGRRARALLESARDRVAKVLGAERGEIAFTSGGTEADNEALAGVARAAGPGARLIATAVEHHAVLAPLDRLRDDGFEVTLLPVDPQGRVAPHELERALERPALLVSVMYANNEIGVVQPIGRLAALAGSRGALFHSDAVQAPRWLPLDVRELGVDLLSISAHKFGGPKGVGALYVRRGVPIAPLLLGGGQEFGLRPGTENVAGAVGLASALELAAAERPAASARAATLRDRLEAGIRAAVPGVRINGAGAPRLPNVLSASFEGTDSAALLIALDLAGVAVAAGSACTAGALEPSHVLAALGLGERARDGTVRFSLGPDTAAEEIDRVVELLPPVVAGLRVGGAGGWVEYQTERRAAGGRSFEQY
jgi:cysteine desulfurase